MWWSRATGVTLIAEVALSLDELDRLLLSIEGVRDAACCGVADKHFGEVIGCLVAPATPSLSQDRLHRAVEDYLGHGVPRPSISSVAAIERTPDG